MTGFDDAMGRRWLVSITLGDLIRVKAQTGLSLADLTDEDRKGKRAVADLERVRNDLSLFCDLLFSLVDKQARELSVDKDAFLASLDGQSLMDAMDAVNEELTVFTLPRSLKDRGRAVVKQRSEAVMTQVEATLAAGLDRLATLTPEEQATIAGLESSPSAGNSPA